MCVRPARPDDAPAIAAVHVAAWQSAYRGLVPADVLDRLDLAQRTAGWIPILADPHQHALVIEADGAVCGFASFGPARDDDLDPARTAELYSIYVAPEHWRRGLGRRLWDAAQAALTAAGFPEVVLWVFAANQPARAFYEAAGFAPDGTGKVENRGVPLTVLRYCRPL
jgi:ribosomal protein S18 acetylase RimI-like enzyme